MLIGRKLAVAAGAAVLGGSLVLPQAATALDASPRAGLECGSNWPHHQYRSGGVAGAYTAYHLCWDNRSNARIDYSSSYVKDTRTHDRTDARVYVSYHKFGSQKWTGVEARATNSHPKAHFQWGDSSTTRVFVYVCRGSVAPWQSHHVCKGV
ncbi:hypothetical protein ACFV2U_39915 [Streptomyces sp. NPDC059697]|uniref:hypothetical protein n=1 Tax=Streptomyces sp. NPDC059697 TaxID=3346912 RepID=UPI0036782C02